MAVVLKIFRMPTKGGFHRSLGPPTAEAPQVFHLSQAGELRYLLKNLFAPATGYAVSPLVTGLPLVTEMSDTCFVLSRWGYNGPGDRPKRFHEPQYGCFYSYTLIWEESDVGVMKPFLWDLTRELKKMPLGCFLQSPLAYWNTHFNTRCED